MKNQVNSKKPQSAETKLGMRVIHTFGIHWMEPVEGSQEWYWGFDNISGDLYEAEETFLRTGQVAPNRLVFLHYPDGTVVQPIKPIPGQYFGPPVYSDGKIIMFLAYFPTKEIKVFQYDVQTEQLALRGIVPISQAGDCYNLLLQTTPLMLIKEGNDGVFKELWPEKQSFPVGNTETFLFQEGEQMYFSAWYEEPRYWEEIIVRKRGTGKILKRVPGSIFELPDGQKWLLK